MVQGFKPKVQPDVLERACYTRWMTRYLIPDTSKYSPHDRLRIILPMLEFAVGSCRLSRKQALIELGFLEENVDKLMKERNVEDWGAEGKP